MKLSPARVARIAERRIAVNCGVLALWALAGAAQAHPEFSQTTTNRYVKFSLLSAGELRLAYTVMYGAEPALLARRAADANHDGRLDDAESAALGLRVRDEVLGAVDLIVDDQRVVPAFDAPGVGLLGAEVAASPLSVDLVARIRTGAAAPHRARFEDRAATLALGETEIRIEESPETRLLAAHRGPSGSERETRFLFRGPKFSALEDRSIGFQWQGVPQLSTGARRGSSPLTRAAGVLALIALAAWTWRRYRRMKG